MLPTTVPLACESVGIILPCVVSPSEFLRSSPAPSFGWGSTCLGSRPPGDVTSKRPRDGDSDPRACFRPQVFSTSRRLAPLPGLQERLLLPREGSRCSTGSPSPSRQTGADEAPRVPALRTAETRRRSRRRRTGARRFCAARRPCSCGKRRRLLGRRLWRAASRGVEPLAHSVHDLRSRRRASRLQHVPGCARRHSPA